MKTNVTLKLDADLLREARVVAAEVTVGLPPTRLATIVTPKLATITPTPADLIRQCSTEVH